MQTRRALKSFSKDKISYDRVSDNGPLARHATELLQRQSAREADIKKQQDRHDFAASLPVLEVARQRLQQVVGERVLPDDVPIVTRFDAFSVIKHASKGNPKDVGLSRFATHLERLWHEDPVGTLTAGALTRLRDHYQSENPMSVVGKATDHVIPKVSFNNLPVAQLSRIAAEVNSQEDYDLAIVRHGLNRDDLHSIRARALVRELVNRKLSNIELEDKQASMGIARRNYSGVAANRVMARIAQEVGPDKDTEDDMADPEEMGMGIDGTGVLSANAFIKEQAAMKAWAQKTGNKLPKVAVAPPGWEGTVKDLKKEKDIDNPWALAWWMKGKGYHPGGKDKKSEDECAADECGSEKTAQTPYGQGWSAENMVELANDVMSEMSNPQVMQLANKIVQDFANKQQMTMPQPGSKQFGELLAYGLQANPGMTNKLKKIMYQSLMSETNQEMVPQQQSQSYEVSQQNPALIPAMASKTAEGGEPSQPEFEPEVNEQQEPQENIKPSDGLKVLKAHIISKDHALVDDGKDHIPIFSITAAQAVMENIDSMVVVPDWWLGSAAELIKEVRAALIKEAGDIPPQFEKHKKKKKDEKGEKEESENPFAKSSKRGFSAIAIEEKLTGGASVDFSNFSMKIAMKSTGQNVIELTTKLGTKQYQLLEMDNAISDFMYLVGTEKMTDPPAPAFYFKEGIRIACLGCNSINSYEMPDEPMALACNNCGSVIPPSAVTAAFKSQTASEETALIAFVPKSKQDEFGDKFAKAAEMLGADSVEADGCRAEAFAITTTEKKADVWDFMIESGFKPLAQEMSTPAMPAGGMMATDEMPEMDIPMEEMSPAGIDQTLPDLGDTPQGNYAWADHQMIQAAMMHYQAQGKNVVEAITEFNKEYGDGYDPETVMQMASAVFGIGLDQIKVGMTRRAGDLPSTSVNQQQPDAISIGNDVPGPDSETKGEIPNPGKPKTQVKPQGTFSNTSTEADSDNKDPGDFGASKPKSQHPATDQSGTSLSDTNLGSHSDSEMGKVMRDMDSKSKNAPKSMQSK